MKPGMGDRLEKAPSWGNSFCRRGAGEEGREHTQGSGLRRGHGHPRLYGLVARASWCCRLADAAPRAAGYSSFSPGTVSKNLTCGAPGGVLRPQDKRPLVLCPPAPPSEQASWGTRLKSERWVAAESGA